MTKAYIKYILALLLFGSNGVVASYIVLSSYEIVLSRTLIGSLFLILLVALGRQKPQLWNKKKSFFFLVLSGAAMGASWMFLYEAYSQIGVSVATLAYYCGPVLVMALAPLLFGEKMTAPKITGFVCVILGMLFVSGGGFAAGNQSWGLLCGILSAVMYAFMVICNKKAVGITGLENAACQLAVSCIVVAAFTFSRHPGIAAIPQKSILPILILGVVNTGIGCYLYFSSLHTLSAQTVSICGYLEPLSALIFSAIFLGEKLSLTQMAGAVLILGGAAFGELYHRRKPLTVK